MTQDIFRNRKPSPRATNALAFALALIMTPTLFSSETRAQTRGYVFGITNFVRIRRCQCSREPAPR